LKLLGAKVENSLFSDFLRDHQHYMSNFYPHAFNGEIVTNSDQCVWYIFAVDGAEVGTIWLEKEKLQDSLVTLGIIIGHPNKLGIGIGQRVIPLAIELTHTKLRFEGVRLFVRKTNSRAIAC
jgi:RimJ/RimL family protein N-acetyltransferase